MRVLLRKSPLCRKHFFEWLKTTVLLFDCGTSTLKSLLLLGSNAPHVHLRLRKRFSRCTLDCGFKTSESPALRGFEAERCPITGTSLYLVLKSNGLRHPKNLPVKFGFSPIDISANIAKKLPSQRCFKPLLIAIFNFPHKRSTFAFTPESGYTLGSAQRIAYSGPHGETGGVSDGGGITTLRAFRTFTNIPGPGIRTASFAAFGAWSGVLPKNAESLRNSDALMRVAVPRRRGPAGLRGLFSFLTKLRLVRPIPETSFSSPDAPACAVPAQAAFPLALSRLGAVQGFSVLSLCLTPFLDFEDKKRPLTIRIVRPVNGLIFDVHFLCSVQQTGICRISTSLLPAPLGRLHKARTES